MTNAKGKKKSTESAGGPSKAAKDRYFSRFTLLRKGQDFSKKDDILQAVQHYNQYLKIVADYHCVDEKKIRPSLFDAEKDLAELLLISQVYWDLAKSYDRNPKLIAETKRCLQQFALFSVGYKFQYLNSELIRRHIKKGGLYNPGMFKETFRHLKMHSSSCYIATYCFGEVHPMTEYFRDFKKKFLIPSYPGRAFIRFYYATSPYLVRLCEKFPVFGEFFGQYFFRPGLLALARFLKRFILSE